MDDGSVADDGTLHPEQIRITTASGSARIILDGSNDFIYAVNSDGSGWIEIGANGEVMVYAKGSMNVRTEKDFNVRADKNINLEAAENINIHSIGNTKLNSDNELHIRSKGTQFIQTEAPNEYISWCKLCCVYWRTITFEWSYCGRIRTNSSRFKTRHAKCREYGSERYNSF